MIPRPAINFHRTPATLIVAAVAVALELVCMLDPDAPARREFYYNHWLGILPRLWAGQLWRPFTSTLMHGGLLHAAFNVYWLVIFGPVLEIRLGSYRYLGLIVLLGYVSMMPEYVVGSYHRDEPIMIVGLSGIVYGLFGMLFIGRRWRPELEAVCDQTTSVLLLGWFVFCIIATRAHVMNVANIAHGAGFAFGVLYGLVVFDARHRIPWAVLATLASLLVLSTLVACPGHSGYENVKRRGALWILQPRTEPRTLAPAHFLWLCGRAPLSRSERRRAQLSRSERRLSVVYPAWERWKWTWRQVPSSSRCQTRVSWQAVVTGLPEASTCCESRT